VAIGGALLKSLVDLTGQTQELTNKLISVSSGIGEANGKFSILAATALRTGSSLGGTVDLFQKLAQSTTFQGSSTESLALVTENFNKTLQISGASGASAASALYQFAQAMQKGTLNGDEFRTITETNGFMMKVLQKELGKSSTELRMMATNGQLSAEVIAKALLNTNMVTESYGKTIKTIPQAFENLNTKLAVTVKHFDDVTGFGRAVVAVIDTLGNNIPAVVGGVTALSAALLILAARMALVRTAMITTGFGALIVGAGVAAGYLADKFGLFGDNVDKSNRGLEEGNKRAKEGLVVTHQRNEQALQLDQTLQQQLKTLKATNDLDAQATGIKSLQLEVDKAIATEAEKYAKTGEKMLPAMAQTLATETQRKILNDERIKTEGDILKIESEGYAASIRDQGVRQVTNQLEAYRLSVTQETYKAMGDQLRSAIEGTIKQRELATILDDQATKQAEFNRLTILDLDTRDATAQVDAKRLQLGTLFTGEMEKQMRASVAIEQATRQRIAEQAQLNLLVGGATPQTREQQIQTATGVIQSADPRLGQAQDYATKKAAIDAAIARAELSGNKLSESQYGQLIASKTQLDIEYRNSKEIADIEFANRDLSRSLDHAKQVQEAIAKVKFQTDNQELILSSQKFEILKTYEDQLSKIKQLGYEEELRRAGFSKTQSEDISKTRLEFEKKNEAEKAQFAIDQGAQMFTALGGYNKQAFEAAKAFNIANAIMNTYSAATKALAAYPPPFGFIAAGAAIGMGLAQVAQIRSQQYAGRAIGGPVAGGTPYMVGEAGPELFIPQGNGRIEPTNQLGSGATVINLNIQAVDTRGIDQLITERKGMIVGMVRSAINDRGNKATM
jgi:tape measure domain-containing protein